jgi:hypothetical protein
VKMAPRPKTRISGTEFWVSSPATPVPFWKGFCPEPEFWKGQQLSRPKIARRIDLDRFQPPVRQWGGLILTGENGPPPENPHFWYPNLGLLPTGQRPEGPSHSGPPGPFFRPKSLSAAPKTQFRPFPTRLDPFPAPSMCRVPAVGSTPGSKILSDFCSSVAGPGRPCYPCTVLEGILPRARILEGSAAF